MTTIKNSPSRYHLLIVFLGFFLLYYPYLRTMVKDWGVNPNYSHGYLIPVISLYMVYSMRETLAKIKIEPWPLGLILIIIACVQLVVARAASEYFLQRTSIIVLFTGVALYFFGKKMTKQLMFPILYLIFMVPVPTIIWNEIAFPLQLLSSQLTENVISLSGMAIYREGNVITLPSITLEVVGACSGLRSLMMMLALSAAIVFFSGLSRTRKIILFLFAVPVAVVGNVFRLTATAFLSNSYGEKFAEGFLHEFSGLVVFFLGLILLMGFYKLLSVEKK